MILPNEPLSNLQIIDAADRLKIPHIRRVYCRNELPSKPNVNECGVINLYDSHGYGTHRPPTHRVKIYRPGWMTL
jgi:hypothetical protein